jgi:hypothetical protein
MDSTILFKINSETDEQMLLKIYQAAGKRYNTLKAFKVLPKAEVKKEEGDNKCLP